MKREEDVLAQLEDLFAQATKERSHYYVGSVVKKAINEITALRKGAKGIKRVPVYLHHNHMTNPIGEVSIACKFFPTNIDWVITFCGKRMTMKHIDISAAGLTWIPERERK